MAEPKEFMSRVIGCVKKQTNGTYVYVISGNVPARGPTRKTKTEAERDADAARKAGDREAAQ